MIRGTTPDYILTIDGYDLSGKTVFVTISQNGQKLTKTNSELSIATDESGSTIAFILSRRDTLRLKVGSAEVQVRFIDAGGTAWATEIATLTVSKVLLERVIEYGNDTP